MSNRHYIGFTLIELMIVVAIIGVLATVAVPMYSYFVKASKSSDGIEKLRAIADGALLYYNSSHHFSRSGLEKGTNIYPGCQEDNAAFRPCAFDMTPICFETAGSMTAPTEIIGIPYPPKGSKALPDASAFDHIQWRRLGFQIGGPTYYCYSYASTAETFTAAAAASLVRDGDSWMYLQGDKDGYVTPIFRNK